jgi:asparagine synthase (glutamine-hydrolysing)
MAHSREIRLPFLSHQLVEFLFTLPSTYKINEGWTKYIIRKSFSDLMPSEIVWRKDKIGYEPPQKKWMQNENVKELIFENRKVLVENNILNKSVLEEKVEENNALERGNNSWNHLMAGKLFS